MNQPAPDDQADSLPADMWELERDHPWLLLAYAAAFVAAIAISAIWPWGLAR